MAVEADGTPKECGRFGDEDEACEEDEDENRLVAVRCQTLHGGASSVCAFAGAGTLPLCSCTSLSAGRTVRESA